MNNHILSDTVSARVTTEAKARLESLCKQQGFNINTMVKMLCECLIRFMDDEHNLSDDLRRIIRMFEDIPGWKKAFSLTDDWGGVEIIEAFYVLRKRGHEGTRMAHVTRPMLENDEMGWTMTYNTQLQLERFIEVNYPSLYRHLRSLSIELGNESIWDTLNTIVNQYRENPDEEELRLQFGQNDLHKGQSIHETQEQAQIRKRTRNTVNQQELFS